MLDAFKDHRYIKVDGKLLFYIFNPNGFPDVSLFIEQWNDLAKKEGLPGFFFVALQESGEFPRLRDMFRTIVTNAKRGNISLFTKAKWKIDDVLSLGFNGVNSRGISIAHYRYSNPFFTSFRHVFQSLMLKLFDWQPIDKYDFKKVSMRLFTDEDRRDDVFPTIIPNWDRSPRVGRRAKIWYNYNPIYFKKQVELALDFIKDKPEQHRILFLMAWNEWGEGNYMEPDLEFGHGYINALYEALND